MFLRSTFNYIVIHEYNQNDFLLFVLKYCHHFNLCPALTAMYSFNATKIPKKTASFAVSFQLELFGRTVNTEFPPTIRPGTMHEAFNTKFWHVLEFLSAIVTENHAKLQKPQRKGVGRITSY